MFTIVELYTDACVYCKKLKTKYDVFLPYRQDVAVRRVKLPNDWSIKSVSDKYAINIRSTPHIIIFDKDGLMIVQDDGKNKDAYMVLQKWIYETVKGKI